MKLDQEMKTDANPKPRFLQRLREDNGAISIELALITVALLAVGGLVTAAIVTLGTDAASTIPTTIDGATGISG